jgi:hypothetical protein
MNAQQTNTRTPTGFILIMLLLTAVLFNGVNYLGNLDFGYFTANTALAHFGNSAIEYARGAAAVMGEFAILSEIALGIFAGYRFIAEKPKMLTSLLIVGGLAIVTGLVSAVSSDMYLIDFGFIGGAAVRAWGERRDAKSKKQG